ncbi:serine O-acetyltransferase [Streptomyces silvisoli]|uniref:Serine acetyltransferase n=1 Tax=Streptomyces silvisoli TaxID=3034235 RepID=A0ABT5ZKW7_9ACTN|nr:serine acetyltransferase [Streptomyces silvisoli]MDF3290473.1 serine acetyltransferase [Streptomyces silvisoli]
MNQSTLPRGTRRARSATGPPRQLPRHDEGLTGLLRTVAEDLRTVVDRDPSRATLLDAVLHPPWQGLVLYRLAHRLHVRGRRFGPGLLTWVARVVSGMEIHAGARIGRRVFIDHGFGVVIGETAVVGNDVTIYHQVTLGSRGWWQDGGPGARRHPVVGDRVTIGVGASLLGPITVADDCPIRAHELVTNDRPGGAR